MGSESVVHVVGDLVSGRPVVVGSETSLRWAARQLEMGDACAAVVGHTRRVDGIISDYPDRLRAVMAEKGLKLPAPTPVEP